MRPFRDTALLISCLSGLLSVLLRGFDRRGSGNGAKTEHRLLPRRSPKRCWAAATAPGISESSMRGTVAALAKEMRG
jgi:hypothetical protein